jgi:hypothetical protein
MSNFSSTFFSVSPAMNTRSEDFPTFTQSPLAPASTQSQVQRLPPGLTASARSAAAAASAPSAAGAHSSAEKMSHMTAGAVTFENCENSGFTFYINSKTPGTNAQEHPVL